jgi:hypothetical protein
VKSFNAEFALSTPLNTGMANSMTSPGRKMDLAFNVRDRDREAAHPSELM